MLLPPSYDELIPSNHPVRIVNKIIDHYTDLEEKGIDAFVKYNYFHKEQRAKNKPVNPFAPDNLHYNKEDCYYCPMGQKMERLDTIKHKTKNGFVQEIARCQAQNCNGCPLRCLCHKSKVNRIIERNYNLLRLKRKAKELLLSE